jgi:uncharacterized membrane protein YecN with MAPEG domain
VYFPIVTLFAAAVLTIVFVVLSVRVGLTRVRTGASLGDGSSVLVEVGKERGAPALLVASRSQANFAEYVPLSLLLLGLIESGGGAPLFVEIMAGLLITARILHPLGMGRPTPNPFRGAILLQWLMLAATGVYGLVLVAEMSMS